MLGGTISGIRLSGWVFFICTGAAGIDTFGKTVMRAVSFFGPGTAMRAVSFFGASGGPGIIGGAGAGPAPDPLGIKGAEDGGGMMGLVGGGGNGDCAAGGRGGPIGGRTGKLMRAVSRESPPAPGGCGFGGSAIRTVSFL